MTSTTHFENIDQEIINQLLEAKYEIKAALAWFTDLDIIRALETKAESGVKVDLILAQNEYNQEANFKKLKELGAQVLFIPPKGYGTMHNKFCVIDESIVINGSYNWTVNAKKNNSENIVVHREVEVARKFLLQHERLKKAIELGKPISDIELEPNKVIDNNGLERDFDVSFKNVLDTMISAEISQFSREDLKQQGYNSAKNSNGDPQILANCFDSLYSSFVNSIDVLDDKKNRLLSKIEEQKTKSVDSIISKYDIERSKLRSLYGAQENTLILGNTEIETQISLNESRINKIENHDLVEIEKEKESIKQEIEALDTEFVKPGFKWFEFIPNVIFTIGFLCYLFLFYSSAAYILIFSSADAKSDRLAGIKTTPPEIFDANALSKASDKGLVAVLILCLFVLIPVVLSIVNKYLRDHSYFKKWPEGRVRLLTYFSFIMVDAFIAYSVTKSIHDVEYLTGTIDDIWEFTMVFSSPDFWLVFVMGALGLFLFDLVYEKLMAIFEERNPDIDEMRKKKRVKLKKEVIKQLTKDQSELKDKIHEHRELITSGTQEKLKNLQSIEQLRSKEAMDIASIESNQQIQIESIQRITDIYKSHIENDNYLISIHAMKDRINTFLDGWVQYLYEVYSVSKASGIIRESNIEAEKWSNGLNDVSKGFKVS
jgi:hypothetical protein